jgi:AP-1 complex subunit beta-1
MHPDVLAVTAVQVFFCKYNDPIYVKMEKLEIMIKLANDKNIDQVLLEFKEYAQEVDVDFVRKVRGWRQPYCLGSRADCTRLPVWC